jgi:ribosomal protein S3
MSLHKIYGLKLLIKGRLKGKMRASSTLLQQGTIPNQTLNKKIDYSMQHVSTLYGVYGLTL